MICKDPTSELIPEETAAEPVPITDPVYRVGDTGSAGGLAFYVNTAHAADGWHYLVAGGSEDWFLPSQAELDLMYSNLNLTGLGSFTSIGYWSSTEDSADNAWRQTFSNGLQSNNIKAATYRVRVIRRF